MPDAVFEGMVTSMEPLAGGYSGETFLARAGEEQVVVRVYGAGARDPGPAAPEIDAAVLELVRGLLPVPRVLEVRRPNSAAGTPGLLVTSFEPGERLEDLLPTLDDEGLARVGRSLGEVLARLGHMAMPRTGEFIDGDLTIRPWRGTLADFLASLRSRGAALDVPGLDALVETADDVNALTRRSCLVHSDFNPKNVLVDPDTLAVTALLDWEFAHAGSPYTDLGNLLRFDDREPMTSAVVETYRRYVPDAPDADELRERACAADLLALLELAGRVGENPVADRALGRLRELAAAHA